MSTLCAFILNVSLCKCCFAHTIEVSLCAVVYLRILSSQHFFVRGSICRRKCSQTLEADPLFLVIRN